MKDDINFLWPCHWAAACGFSSMADYGGRKPKNEWIRRESCWSHHYPWSQSCKIDWIFSNFGSNGSHLTWSSLGHSEMFTGRTASLWSTFAHLNQNRNVLGWIGSSCWFKRKLQKIHRWKPQNLLCLTTGVHTQLTSPYPGATLCCILHISTYMFLCVWVHEGETAA